MSKIIVAIVTFTSIVLLLSFLLSWPVMMLWNGCLVDAVDGVHEITWLQAWGISTLFGLLFRSYTSNNSKD
jgi:hypothetical protein